MINSQKFSDLYNQLDQAFAKSLGQTDHLAFSQKMRELIFKNPVVRSYKDNLYQLGNLLNAITHQSKGGISIADLYQVTVD